MSDEYSATFWEERYRSHSGVSSRGPNPQLVAEARDLTPGTSLDAGCGEGANAIWLAEHGWRVTAVDCAPTALRHAREHAETLGPAITSRIEWVEADLTTWTPPEEQFDLVTAHYVHPAAPYRELLDRLAAAVAPGGTLLIVGHHHSDPHHASTPEICFAVEEAAASLDPGRWAIAVAEARSRTVTDDNGHETLMRDAVLRAHKRPSPSTSTHIA